MPVPTGLPRVIAFLHPIMALATLGFMAYVASLGLRSRERTEAYLRPRHARLAPWVLGVMATNLGVGVLSTWYLRPDLRLAESAHFRISFATLAVLASGAVLSRWIGTNETARWLHPILGLLALVLSGLQVLFGLPMLPL